MNNDDSSTQGKLKTTNGATPVKNVSVFTNGRIVEVKLGQKKKSPASNLSSRPSKSLFKTKSLTKPFKAKR